MSREEDGTLESALRSGAGQKKGAHRVTFALENDVVEIPNRKGEMFDSLGNLQAEQAELVPIRQKKEVMNFTEKGKHARQSVAGIDWNGGDQEIPAPTRQAPLAPSHIDELRQELSDFMDMYTAFHGMRKPAETRPADQWHKLATQVVLPMLQVSMEYASELNEAGIKDEAQGVLEQSFQYIEQDFSPKNLELYAAAVATEGDFSQVGKLTKVKESLKTTERAMTKQYGAILHPQGQVAHFAEEQVEVDHFADVGSNAVAHDGSEEVKQSDSPFSEVEPIPVEKLSPAEEQRLKFEELLQRRTDLLTQGKKEELATILAEAMSAIESYKEDNKKPQETLERAMKSAFSLVPSVPDRFGNRIDYAMPVYRYLALAVSSKGEVCDAEQFYYTSDKYVYKDGVNASSSSIHERRIDPEIISMARAKTTGRISPPSSTETSSPNDGTPPPASCEVGQERNSSSSSDSPRPLLADARPVFVDYEDYYSPSSSPRGDNENGDQGPPITWKVSSPSSSDDDGARHLTRGARDGTRFVNDYEAPTKRGLPLAASRVRVDPTSAEMENKHEYDSDGEETGASPRKTSSVSRIDAPNRPGFEIVAENSDESRAAIVDALAQSIYAAKYSKDKGAAKEILGEHIKAVSGRMPTVEVAGSKEKKNTHDQALPAHYFLMKVSNSLLYGAEIPLIREQKRDLVIDESICADVDTKLAQLEKAVEAERLNASLLKRFSNFIAKEVQSELVKGFSRNCKPDRDVSYTLTDLIERGIKDKAVEPQEQFDMPTSDSQFALIDKAITKIVASIKSKEDNIFRKEKTGGLFSEKGLKVSFLSDKAHFWEVRKTTCAQEAIKKAVDSAMEELINDKRLLEPHKKPQAKKVDPRLPMSFNDYRKQHHNPPPRHHTDNGDGVSRRAERLRQEDIARGFFPAEKPKTQAEIERDARREKLEAALAQPDKLPKTKLTGAQARGIQAVVDILCR